jgi:hypothetical protein
LPHANVTTSRRSTGALAAGKKIRCRCASQAQRVTACGAQTVASSLFSENLPNQFSLAGGRHACPDTCMEVISARRADAVRVETERVRQ